MPVMIQIRHVPEDLHGRIKARAAKEGMSMSNYLLRLIENSLGKLTMEEFSARLASREPYEPKELIVDTLQAGREERDEELMRRVRPRRFDRG
jgi:plasmid stability protein